MSICQYVNMSICQYVNMSIDKTKNIYKMENVLPYLLIINTLVQ